MTQIEPRPTHDADAASKFPPGFLWGAATAAYQVEGAATEDGRGASIWDTFSHTPGKVRDGDTGDVAVDHYHRYRDDVQLMARLGIKSYRFSVAWARVLPQGSGAVNAKGLDFYSRLVDELLNNDISPAMTLYHWDLPQALQDQGGWVNRDTAARFADYAAVLAGALGDRVQMWTTLNEPWCSAFLGYAAGVHAPGHTDGAEALAAAHHLLLGHGLATQRLRAELPASARLSITLNPVVARPATDSAADRAAATKVDGLQTRLWVEPLFRARYPDDVLEFTRDVTDWSFVQPGDLATIATPIDVLGVNYYNPVAVAHYDGSGSRAQSDGHGGGNPWPGCDDVQFIDVDGPHTAMNWPVDASGLYDLLTRLWSDYGVPMAITENGAAYDDKIDVDLGVHDSERVAYLHDHLREVEHALADGVDLRGYYVWSLFDNFEWSYGYSKRFGIVYVDYETQVRTVKDSGQYYSRVARSGAIGG
jgi:beta-glucosidase